MKITCRAPLRLELAGGGTDLPSYRRNYEGKVFNACIQMYAYTTIEDNEKGISFISSDNDISLEYDIQEQFVIDAILPLQKAAYNRIVKSYCNHIPFGFTMHTFNEGPKGSGLGTSSAMLVSILAALLKYRKIELSKEELAALAVKVEREDLGFSGGTQDQYAAVYGGIHLMTFYKNDKVDVHHLHLSTSFLNNISSRFLILYTGLSHVSHQIVDNQEYNILHDSKVKQAFDRMKENAISLANAFETANIQAVHQILNNEWQNKKGTTNKMTNEVIDSVVEFIMQYGVDAVRISGSGGGGFLIISVPIEKRLQLCKKLENKYPNNKIYPIQFDWTGITWWEE